MLYDGRLRTRGGSRLVGLRPTKIVGLLTRGQPLVTAAYSLMLTTVVNAILGVGFWIVAARLVSPASVGRDSALISALLALSTVGQLNLHNIIIRFLPRNVGHASKFVVKCYGVALAATLAAGALFVVLAPTMSAKFAFLGRDHTLAMIFIGACALWTVFALQDSALTALRRTPWVLIENTVFGAVKLAVIPLVVVIGLRHVVFTAWVIPMALLVIPVNLLLFRRAISVHQSEYEGNPSSRAATRGIKAFIAMDYVASSAEVLAVNGLPVFAVALLGGRRTAYFYIPFLIVSSFDLLFENVATSLLVEGSFMEERLAELAKETIRKFGGLLAVAIGVVVVAAPLLLMPFGSAYASHGSTALRLFACASGFRGIVSFYGTVCRVRRGARGIMIANSIFAVLLFGFTALDGARWGVTGLALAWLVSAAVVALGVVPFLKAPLGSGGH
jgi:O-antigen/teichoic acid export membrane protein